jgi:uncharacterized repeat protein (TIGR04138 family)
MQKNNFDQVVAEILKSDTRFDVQAYRFVREGLDYTLKLHKRTNGAAPRHVSGPELLEGLRQFTLKEFGPMGKTVLNEWGVSRCEDFGQIVFSLVKKGILGKSENDKPEDFTEVFTFDEAFVQPFLPAKTARRTRPTSGSRSRLPKNAPPDESISNSPAAEGAE